MTSDATRGTEAAATRRRIGLVAVPVLVFGLIAIMFAFALRSGDPSKLPSVLIGKPAPAMDLPPIEGLIDRGRAVPGFTARALASGEPSVVNFWASWCVPCLQEHPLLMDLGQRGIAVHGINFKDQPAAARRFLGLHGNPFRMVGADSGRAAIEWGVYGMPETFVVDGRGVIIAKHVGPLTAEAIASKILPAIEKARRP